MAAGSACYTVPTDIQYFDFGVVVEGVTQVDDSSISQFVIRKVELHQLLTILHKLMKGFDTLGTNFVILHRYADEIFGQVGSNQVYGFVVNPGGVHEARREVEFLNAFGKCLQILCSISGVTDI